MVNYHLKSIGADLYVEEDQNLAKIIDNADRDGLDTPGFMTMMSSFEGYLMIYKDTKLAWTTKLPSVPVYIGRAQF